MTSQIVQLRRTDDIALASSWLLRSWFDPWVIKWFVGVIGAAQSHPLRVRPLGTSLSCQKHDQSHHQSSGKLSAETSETSEANIKAQVDQEQWHYRAILEDQTELICRYSQDTTILYVNDAYCRYFGLSKQNLIGKSYAPVIYEADRPEVTRLVNSMNCHNPQVTIENRVIVDGQVRWTQWNNRCFYDEQGRILGFQSVGRDITRLKETEIALRASEQRYRTLIETIPQLVWVAEADGVTRIDYNQRWFDYTGRTPATVMGNYWLSVIHPDDVATALQQWQKAVSAGTSYEAEYRLRRADGEYVWHLSKAEPIWNSQGQIIRWYGTCTDISERKCQETARQQAQADLQHLNETLELRVADRTKELVVTNEKLKREIQERQQAQRDLQQLNLTLEQQVRDRTQALEEANQELEAFSYSIAHDLRAPLRAIQGFAQVLVEDYAHVLDDLGKEYIQRMSMSAEHLDILIQDLLTYSSLGRTELHLQPIDVAAVVESILADLEPALRAKQASIQIASDLPIVYAQRSVLKQILSNLIDNALKFVAVDIQPQIRIWAEQKICLADDSDVHFERVRIWVEDNGIGIDNQHQQRIFRTFERLHGVEAYPGTGIGLAIVKRGVERLGGQVGVESTLDQGSRFWIELPPG